MPLRAVLALFLLTSPARAQQPGESNVAALAAADSAAHAWLALLGAGGYVASWQTASPHMKQRIREQDWTLRAEAYRDQFARSERRKTVDSRYQRSVPPNPPAEYATFRYVTTLTPERQVWETVLLVLDEEGVWRVADYVLWPNVYGDPIAWEPTVLGRPRPVPAPAPAPPTNIAAPRR